MRVELLEDGATVRRVEVGGDAEGLGASRAAGNGEGEAALGRVEMSILCNGELELVSKGSAGGRVVEGACCILFTGLLQLGALSRGKVRTHIEGSVNGIGQDGKELIMHHEFTLQAGRLVGRGSRRW